MGFNRDTTLLCISLALAGAVALPAVALDRYIALLGQIAVLLLLIPLVFNKRVEGSLAIVIGGSAVALWLMGENSLSLAVALLFVVISCLLVREYRCFYTTSLLPLVIANALGSLLALVVAIVLISVASLRSTRRLHSLLLLISIGLFAALNHVYWGVLMASILAGLLSIDFSWPPSCPFGKELSLVSVGTIISIISASLLSFTDHYNKTYVLAFWELGFLLQISGVMVPRSLQELKPFSEQT